ncbi:MAG TPA: DNA-binding protein [Gammaproteobacteria bacterium]|nr:DNA-binding protein [Gammaproteobacteria bacterium]
MQGRIFGTVLETMDAGGYTYVLLDTGTQKVWAAAPKTPVRRGSMVAVSTQMPMRNFNSKALNREFELVYFTDRIIKDNLDRNAAAGPQVKAAEQPPADAPIEGIRKADGGKTIAEILEQKKALDGKSVRVRGKVVKYSRQVMGRNWIHIRDSSTADDLTITTNDSVKVGDVILAEGKVVLDSDFGYGYVYAVLLEDSKVTVE